ncbi:type II toxin-antitoxin system HipA family toxin YjjJ [Kosakonia cowanii]
MSLLSDALLQGPRTAADLRSTLQISQATFSRLTAAEPHILQFGKARATRYALLRPVRGIELFPLWRIDENGRACKWGELRPCWRQGSCLVSMEDGSWQWFDGIPWYLTDLRPQGFLGRAWGRNIARQFELPEDIRLWQEEDVLFALAMSANEQSGGWLIGEAGYQKWIAASPPAAITEDEKLNCYAELAFQALQGEIIGSSAGGEQPKFMCYAQTGAEYAHRLVKFTAPQSTEAAVRWGDLLMAESLALAVLANAGIESTHSVALMGENRQVFLETRRFDCVGTEGRRAIVSLESLQSEFVSSPGAWPKVVAELVKQRQTDAESLTLTEQIWAFGRLIANSDMHAGNLSFFLSTPPMKLTPVYDMLPMAFAPATAGMMRQEAVDLVVDTQVKKEALDVAIPLANQFWQAVADDIRISDGFRRIARDMRGKVEQAARSVDRMA